MSRSVQPTNYGNPKQWAEKVERAATDPHRIEKRKQIAPTIFRVEWTGGLKNYVPIKESK